MIQLRPHDLVSLGYIEEILNKLEILESENPELSPFAQQARQLAQSYQVEKLESMMKEYVDA